MCNKFMFVVLAIFISFLLFMGYSIEHRVRVVSKEEYNGISYEFEIIEKARHYEVDKYKFMSEYLSLNDN